MDDDAPIQSFSGCYRNQEADLESFDIIKLNLKLKKKNRKPLAILVEKESTDIYVNQDISVNNNSQNKTFASTPSVSEYKLP
uniref:Uncharacterized protein n=1 Tax=Strongyloides venezuelensis TaxID=75913 RepID=A0A0K0G5Q5_STRVS